MATNLWQKLALVAGELKGMEVSGKNQYGAAALSIDDVEGALAEKFAAHGLVSVPNTISLDWDGKLWIKEIELTIYNADAPEERVTASAKDVGSNPSAADSFARKVIYKGLLHLPGDAPDKGEPADAVTPGENFRTRAVPRATPTPGTPAAPKPSSQQRPTHSGGNGHSDEPPPPSDDDNPFALVERPTPTATRPQNAVPAQRRPVAGPSRR